MGRRRARQRIGRARSSAVAPAGRVALACQKRDCASHAPPSPGPRWAGGRRGHLERSLSEHASPAPIAANYLRARDGTRECSI
jgi:hypothetical protein